MKLDFNENQYDMYDPYNQRVMIQPWFWWWFFPPQFSHQVLQDLRILQDHLDRQGHQVLQDLHSHQDHLDHQDHQGLLIQENTCKKAHQFVPFCDFCFFSSLTYSIQATPIAPAKSNIRSFIVSLRASCPCKGISSSSYSVERVVSIYC